MDPLDLERFRIRHATEIDETRALHAEILWNGPDLRRPLYDRPMSIHPTAVISDECEIEGDVTIGPFCCIEGRVRIGAGSVLQSAVTIHGPATIGQGVQVYPQACIGTPGQDFKFKPGDPSAGVEVGSGSILREASTVHAATKPDHPTRLGERVFMMVGAHVGHDSVIESDVILMNHVAVAGHVHVGERSVISALSVIHQFTRVGRLVMMSGGSGCSMHVPPFCMVNDRNRMGGINAVGMRRGGLPREEITAVRRAFRDALLPPLTKTEMIEILREYGEASPSVMEMAEFVESATGRGICYSYGRAPRGVVAWLKQLREQGKDLMDAASLDDSID
jgi:UDP-N-acetylglucosamine acyltransferase